MRSIMSFAAVGASLLSTVVYGAPQYNKPSGSSSISYHATSTSYSNGSSSGSTSIPNVNDGFPMPNDDQLRKIEELAHGTLPNGPPPPPGSISPEGITNLQFIEFNENFEVAFFSSLLHNVTTNVSGYEIKDSKQRDFVIEVLIAVLAQEELHAINAELGLKSQNQQPILPCKYVFPTTNFDDAIVLAATFTDLVLGTLQDVTEIFADNNDNAQTRGVASVVGQEGEQEGFFRLLQNKNLIPNALPFLTTSTRDFAFSALQSFVVPGSCPNEDLINLKVFGVLNVNTKNIQPKDQDLEFSFDIKTLFNSRNLFPTSGSKGSNYNEFGQYFKGSDSKGSNMDYSKFDYNSLSLVYINQQNTPIVEQLKNVQIKGTVVTFKATFPFEEYLLNSLTIASVTIGKGPFASANDVANASLFAPGLIEIN